MSNFPIKSRYIWTQFIGIWTRRKGVQICSRVQIFAPGCKLCIWTRLKITLTSDWPFIEFRTLQPLIRKFWYFDQRYPPPLQVWEVIICSWTVQELQEQFSNSKNLGSWTCVLERMDVLNCSYSTDEVLGLLFLNSWSSCTLELQFLNCSRMWILEPGSRTTIL